MPLPHPESVLDHLRRVARDARQAIQELLDVSELRSRFPPGQTPILILTASPYRWHIRDPRGSERRFKALGLYREFQQELGWILLHHDRLAGDRLRHLGDAVFRIIDQRGDTEIESIGEAEARVAGYFGESLETLAGVFDPLEGMTLLAPDTNVLIDFPDLTQYHLDLPAVWIVFTPTVLGELDDKKRSGKRDAQRVIRQLKDSGDRGDILNGVPISDRVTLMTVAAEPGREGLLDWLDLDEPDDRFVASALEVRRTHPKAKLFVVSRDFNVLNKAQAARLAAVDPEEFFPGAER